MFFLFIDQNHIRATPGLPVIHYVYMHVCIHVRIFVYISSIYDSDVIGSFPLKDDQKYHDLIKEVVHFRLRINIDECLLTCTFHYGVKRLSFTLSSLVSSSH